MQVMMNKMSSKGQGDLFSSSQGCQGLWPTRYGEPWPLKKDSHQHGVPSIKLQNSNSNNSKNSNLPSPLFISAMASQQDDQGLHAQETQFREIFLSLSKGHEELRTLLMRNLAKKSPGDDKDERLKRLQAEVDTMRTQMLVPSFQKPQSTTLSNKLSKTFENIFSKRFTLL